MEKGGKSNTDQTARNTSLYKSLFMAFTLSQAYWKHNSGLLWIIGQDFTFICIVTWEFLYMTKYIERELFSSPDILQTSLYVENK